MNQAIIRGFEAACAAQKRAYAPYSNFKVGAAITLKSGEIITGCNIENASYGLTNCAERTALFKVYEAGYSKNDITQLVVVADAKRPVSPCGACRQVMAELMNKDCPVIMMNLSGEMYISKVCELLPYQFDGDDLNV